MSEKAEKPLRLFILVTHLLGTGHLARALAIGRAATARGHDVVVASGGMPAAHLLREGGPRLLQLPPARSDGTDFVRLLGADGSALTEAERRARVDALLAALEAHRPHALVTELFPFGRRVLAAEFEAVLAAAWAQSPRPKTFCSIRDVLAPPSTEKKARQTEERLARWYDGVLVHGDPAITLLEASWPASETLMARVGYTGFVAPPPAPEAPEGDGAGEILVSAGGGPVGAALFEAAVGAAGLAADPATSDPRLAGRRWRLLVGGGDAEARIAALREAAAPGALLTIEPVRPDFREMLGRAALSISQAGYNTALDVAAAGVRAVLVPFEEGGETEQRQRATAFADRYGYGLVREAALSAESLATAAALALDGPGPSGPPPDLDGAIKSVMLIEEAAG